MVTFVVGLLIVASGASCAFALALSSILAVLTVTSVSPLLVIVSNVSRITFSPQVIPALLTPAIFSVPAVAVSTVLLSLVPATLMPL